MYLITFKTYAWQQLYQIVVIVPSSKHRQPAANVASSILPTMNTANLSLHYSPILLPSKIKHNKLQL